MNFKTTLSALALAIGLAQGASAATTTIDFSNGETGSFFSDGTTYTATAASVLFPRTAAVSVSADGLGVKHLLDSKPSQIDGTPLLTSETLTITFSRAVKLLNFTLGLVDGNDDFEIAYNGGTFAAVAAGFTNPFVVLGQTYVSSFSIRASGAACTGTLRRPVCTDGLLGNDDFTLAKASVVPLPAAGFMLLAGLGGLAAMRRRKALV